MPTPKVLVNRISKELQETKEFQNLQTYYPGMGIVCEIKDAPKDDIWLDHAFRIVSAESVDSKSSTPLSLRIERNGSQPGVDVMDVSGFRKVTHLLDPVTWLQGKYSAPRQTLLPGHNETWGSMNAKLQDPMNQAYIEALATYSFSRLREGEYTPHFHKFFGAFCGVAKNYLYNITDSYMSYRHHRWFWDAQEKKLFEVAFEEENLPDDIRTMICEKPTDVFESDDEGSEEELKGLDCEAQDSGSLKSADMSDMKTVDDSEDDGKEEEQDDEDDDDSDSKDDLTIFAKIQNFPVMVIYTECSEGTMDDLLDDFESVGARPGTPQWELRWKSWIFQVIAALCVGQSVFGFTHNDLHSNNIVWSKTDQEYLHYTCRDGLHFKVPTFGKIFRLIDFGRAIFKINSHLFFSDDFRPGNDAAEQFNFGEIFDETEEEVQPNPSFDLSRFAVSVFEGIFPSSPPIKTKAAVLSQEKGLKMMETDSHLYNMMWSWLVCDDGHNVLMEPDGKERYPDFELYKVIASQVHNAIPSSQIKKPAFEEFRVKKKAVSDATKVYSLFC